MRRRTARSNAQQDPPVDAEARALMANPVFRAMLQEAKNTNPEGDISLEELERRSGGLTEADRAFANVYADALDQLLEEQSGDITDEQDHLLELVLLAASHIQNGIPLDQLTADSGIPEGNIRAVAVALRAIALKGARPIG